jgi:hypothetical protein
MHKILYLFFVFYVSSDAQSQISVSFIDSTRIKADKVIGGDPFGTIYYVSEENSFHKKNKDTTITYANVQLSKISSANSFNPLKINLFYKDFNTAVILDNRLAEIYKIDFNATKTYKNVTHISTGYDNTIWIFNQDTQQLELFDYKINSSKARTLPLQSDVLDLKSNYNYCWLLTKEYLYKFNYFGLNILKLKNSGFTRIANFNENLILKKDEILYYLKNNSSDPIEVRMPKLLINDFFVNNETLYIYDNEFLYKYQLKIK